MKGRRDAAERLISISYNSALAGLAYFDESVSVIMVLDEFVVGCNVFSLVFVLRTDRPVELVD